MLSYRMATQGDLTLYFELANDPDVRSNSFNSKIINLKDHIKWFEQKLISKNSHLLIIQKDSEDIGQVRIEVSAESVINFSIEKNYRGFGHSKEILRLAAKYFFQNSLGSLLVGYVKKDNIPSQKAFERAGFKSEHMSDKIRYYMR